MIISHKHKFIFIHINHCGGTSIEDALKPYGRALPHLKDRIGQRHVLDRSLSINASQHLNAAELRNFYGPEIWNSYFKFAFIANPFDRFISAYIQRGKMIYGFRSLLHFIRGGYCNPEKPLRSIHGTAHGSPPARMTQPCLNWLSDKKGEPLDIDFIGRKENLIEDFQVVQSKLGINVELPTKNKTKNKKPYQDYYCKESLRWTTKRMQKDLDHFGYKF